VHKAARNLRLRHPAMPIIIAVKALAIGFATIGMSGDSVVTLEGGA